MPNQDLKGSHQYCPVLEKKLSYEYMKKLKSYFDNHDESDGEFIKYGGISMKQWLDNTLGDMRDSVRNPKKSRMDAGEDNMFKKTHEKDNDNADPTRVRMPKIAKGTNHDYIMANKTVYESISQEINSIKYLIEYMNNKKQIIK